jgi:hypothetical protein
MMAAAGSRFDHHDFLSPPCITAASRRIRARSVPGDG